MRYRLSTLLVAMVWVGLVCLALRSPNQWWSGSMFALLVLVLLTAVLVAIYRTGQLRAMAIGFVIFSASYLMLERGFWPAGELGMHLPTRALFDRLFAVLHSDLPDVQRRIVFYGICKSTLAIVVGIIGGIVAQALCYTRPVERPPPAATA